MHTIILKLLKDGSYVLEEVIEKNESNKLIVNIFELCYEFLLKFCKNDNKNNKKLLYQDLEIFVQHLEYLEVGQTSLICEIFRNNYKISVQITEKLILAYLDKISKTAFNKGGHDPRYLDLFDNIMFDKNEPIKENSIKIVNFIFDSNKKYDFLFMREERSESPDDVEDIPQTYHVFNLEIDSSNNNDVPYIYHARALKILNNCIKCSDDKQILKFICQKILSLNYILELLCSNDIYFYNDPKCYLTTILNSELSKFLNEVWLNSEKLPSSLFNNKLVVKYIKKHTISLRHLKRHDIEEIKNQKSSSAYFDPKKQLNKNFEYETIEKIILEREEEKGSEEEQESEEEEEKEIEKKKLEEIIRDFGKGYKFDYVDSLFNEILPVIISLNKVKLKIF